MNFAQIRKQWAFYITHSLRDLGRNGGRTAFALFCIATGVAAVVALRSLALMIGDELTLNLAEINRGDIQIVASNDIDPDYYTRNNQNELVFTQDGMAALRDWANDENIEIQFAANQNLVQLVPPNAAETGQDPFTVIPILVDPATWPYYGAVFSSDPEVKPLAELFPDGERNVVMSRRIALDNDIQIGDSLQISGVEEPVIVSHFVDDQTEGSVLLRNGPAGFLGFIYYPLDRADDLNVDPLPERAHVRIPLGRNVAGVDESLEERFGEGIARVTTIELEEQNSQVADLVNDLILVMGLSAILIGGIGIINTMNVIVARRTLEIAVLKTMGLKAWRVTVLFLVEAALMGLIGSIIGIIGGIGLSYIIRGVGEAVLRADLTWRAYPEAWYSGLTLGIVITIAFGFLPTLNAGQVRPAGVLRPNEIELPTAGLTRTLSALLAVLVLFGFTLNIIVEGEVELPVSLMLGLGGFIVGMFGGVMLHNEGILAKLDTGNSAASVRRSLYMLPTIIGAVAMIAAFAANLLTEVSPIIIYLVPLGLIPIIFVLLRSLVSANPNIGLSIAKFTRQFTLFVGAILLGGLVGGGLFAAIRTVQAVLYPNDIPPLQPVAIGTGILAVIVFVIFRLRGRSVSGVVGLALLGAMVLTALGFGLGDLLGNLFGDFGFWNEIERFSAGIIVVEIIAFAIGITYVLMLGVVWLIGRIPTFGNVDMKLALRNINARRSRTAATMIGLVGGIGALSLITLTTSGVTALLEGQLETDIGGNVVILSRDPNAHEAVNKRLESTIEGVRSYSNYSFYAARIMLVDGEEPDIEGFRTGDAADGNRRELGVNENEEGIGFAFATIDPSDFATQFTMERGRFLQEDDIGRPVMVVREPLPGSFFAQLDFDLGSVITWQLEPAPGTGEEPFLVDFEIVGIIERNSEESAASEGFQAPIGSVPDTVRPESLFTIADVEDEYVDAAIVEIAQIANAFAFDTGTIVDLIQNLLDQLLAIPALVAALALVAGIAIIANTVALDTQERRRQIGVMKAVGLKGHRVLAQLVFENALIGFISGLIGAAIGLFVTVMFGALGDAEQLEQTLQIIPALRLIGIGVFVSVVATLVAAWTAATEKPMNVLRYE